MDYDPGAALARVTVLWLPPLLFARRDLQANEQRGLLVSAPAGSLLLSRSSNRGAGTCSNGPFPFVLTGQTAGASDPASVSHRSRSDRRRGIGDHAKRNGANFRAVGNEPGWHLQILGRSRVLSVADHGATRVEQPLPEPTTAGAMRNPRLESGRCVLEISGQICRDTIGGESFSSNVNAAWNRRTREGRTRASH